LIMYRMSTISPPTEPESRSSPNCKDGKPNASEHEQHTLHMYQNYMINQFSLSIHPSHTLLHCQNPTAPPWLLP
jgi:hypothetical protein